MMLYAKKKIHKALRETSKRWANIYQGHKQSVNNCPLCDMFLFLNDCRMCPVMDKTGLSNCEGTPYIDWANHQKKDHGVNRSTGMVVRCKDCTKYAEKQYLFISKLLKDQR